MSIKNQPYQHWNKELCVLPRLWAEVIFNIVLLAGEEEETEIGRWEAIPCHEIHSDPKTSLAIILILVNPLGFRDSIVLISR